MAVEILLHYMMIDEQLVVRPKTKFYLKKVKNRNQIEPDSIWDKQNLEKFYCFRFPSQSNGEKRPVNKQSKHLLFIKTT